MKPKNCDMGADLTKEVGFGRLMVLPFCVIVAFAIIPGCSAQSERLASTATALVATALVGAASSSSPTAFATLSMSPMEAAAAPAYNRVALLRSNAARLLRAGRISVYQANHILGLTDQIRAELDAAVRTGDLHTVSMMDWRIEEGFSYLSGGHDEH